MDLCVIEPKENESYDEYIFLLRSSRLNEKIEGYYMERHHIVPKSIGGTDDEENLIWLFPQEHYYAHKLLAIENPDNIKLLQAWNIMSHSKDKGILVSQDEYAEIRKRVSIQFSGANNPVYGRCHTEEEREKMKVNHKDFSHENHPKARPIICIELNFLFFDGDEICLSFGTSDSSSVNRACKGLYNKVYGYHWRFASKEEFLLEKEKRNYGEVPNFKPKYQKCKPPKPVVRIEDNRVFLSANEGSMDCSNYSNAKQIINVCNGLGKIASGYHWRWATDEEIEKENKLRDSKI